MEMRDKRRLGLGLAVLVLAAVMITVGISRGEMGTVVQKAVNICFECIGLG